MKKIIECIPNFSEGRDQKKIAAILQAIKAVPGVILLDHESDTAHNRSVVTFAGEPEDVLEAAFQSVKKAAELIDLEKHRGEHPRMGATDVCPLVPLSGVTEEECIAHAEKLAQRIAEELEIPVYLYEKAAHRPERVNLANIRKGEYESIKKEIATDPKRAPDFGPRKTGTAGAIAIGVRAPLIAYNVNLNTDNLKIAKTIAKKIREKDGGFKCVKALGFALEDRGIVQVSMNLTDYRVTPPHKVFRAIKKAARNHGIKILESEIVGLIPQEALIQSAKQLLKIHNFKNEQILEVAMQKKSPAPDETLADFMEKVASKKSIPGGGSVSALAGALAAALLSMVARLTRTDMSQVLEQTEKLRNRLYKLVQEDAGAYENVVRAYKSGDKTTIQKALKKASQTPLETARTAAQLLEPLKILQKKGNQNALSDCGVAQHLIATAIKGAILNVEINLKAITGKQFIKTAKKEISSLQNPLQQLK